MKKLSLSVVVIAGVGGTVALALWLLSFTGGAILRGRYVAFPQRNLNNVEVEFTLFKDEQAVNRYQLKLKRDGSFSTMVKESGEYLLMQTGARYTSDVFVEPRFSTDMRPHFYNFEQRKVIVLDELYISEAIEVSSPKRGWTCTNADELIFEWPKIPFAHYYRLQIFQTGHLDKDELAIDIQTPASTIAYREARALDLAGEDATALKAVLAGDSVGRKFRQLKRGKFRVGVLAYRLSEDKKHKFLVGRTSADKTRQTHFVVQ
ncbi:MAG: hypothetical protein ACYS76_14190 [Planctomycetota bacterium]|jgi:hypothetical protein